MGEGSLAEDGRGVGWVLSLLTIASKQPPTPNSHLPPLEATTQQKLQTVVSLRKKTPCLPMTRGVASGQQPAGYRVQEAMLDTGTAPLNFHTPPFLAQ